MGKKEDDSIVLRKDDKFYAGYCLETPQVRGQGNTKREALEDAKEVIRLCRSYLKDKKDVSKIL